MKRSVLMTLLAGICAVSICGCGQDAGGQELEAQKGETQEQEMEEAGNGSEKTELVYYTWADEEGYISKVVDAFNAQSETTHVTATYIPSSGTDYDEKIVSMLSSQSEMDLFSASNVKSLVRYIDAECLADMTEAIENSDLDMAKYGTSFLSTGKEGKFYGLPYRYSTMALFFNKHIFDQEGIPYPSQMSWEEYAELAKELTKEREDGTMQWGGFLPDWLGEPILTVQRGSNVMDEDTSALKEWLGLLERLYITDKSHMSFEEMRSTSTDWLKIFLAGDVAMLPNGEWTIGNAMQEISNNADVLGDFEMGVTFMPLPEGINEPVTVGGPNTFIMINQNSENFDSAFEFASFLCGPEGAPYLIEGGMIPAYLDEETIQLYKDTVGVDGVEDMLAADTLYESSTDSDFSQVDTIWREEKELCLIGEQTLDESIENFEKRRAEVK